MNIEPTSAMEKILKAFSSYPDSFARDYAKDRIFFSESGLATLGTVIGFISGIWLTGQKEMANNYADEFLKWLDYTCPEHKVAFNIGTRDVSVPGRICELRADGTMMGFSVFWYVLIEDQTQQQHSSGRQVTKWGTWEAKYVYQMNGGLLFHGSNQENFAVQIGKPTLWSLHT